MSSSQNCYICLVLFMRSIGSDIFSSDDQSCASFRSLCIEGYNRDHQQKVPRTGIPSRLPSTLLEFQDEKHRLSCLKRAAEKLFKYCDDG